jgi:hypothetical protein
MYIIKHVIEGELSARRGHEGRIFSDRLIEVAYNHDGFVVALAGVEIATQILYTVQPGLRNFDAGKPE